MGAGFRTRLLSRNSSLEYTDIEVTKMEKNNYVRNAKACVKGNNQAPALKGNVTFTQKPDGVIVTAQIQGLPQSETGFYALHIHEGENCGGMDFAETGGHYNPKGMPHPKHAGDLPPLLSYHGGMAFMQVMTSRFRVEEIIGRTVVIHSGTDDFQSQPAGNAGTKIACGLIRKV